MSSGMAQDVIATPQAPRLTPFATSFLSLPPELSTHILLYLSPDDLGILSRVVEPLAGVESDAYLRAVWFHHTAPSRVEHALFSPLSLRPDPMELVRRGTLRGVAVISGVRGRGYWASEPAVRLSKIHESLTRRSLTRSLNHALNLRPSRPTLVSKGILPASALRASPSICATAHLLERAKERDSVRRALRDRVGRSTFPDFHRKFWGEGQRVLLAICPSIRGRVKFWEGMRA